MPIYALKGEGNCGMRFSSLCDETLEDIEAMTMGDILRDEGPFCTTCNLNPYLDDNAKRRAFIEEAIYWRMQLPQGQGEGKQ